MPDECFWCYTCNRATERLKTHRGNLTMRLVFDEEKATQAAAYLLRKYPDGRHNLMAILKMLYLADRKALIESGYSITGDHMVSMPHGPVLSQILDLINCGPNPDVNLSPWFAAISPRDGYDVRILHDPGVEALSEYETEVLDSVYERFGNLDPFKLRDLTHKLPEWKDPEGSSYPIDPVEILRQAGVSDAEIRQIIEEAEQRFAMRHAST